MKKILFIILTILIIFIIYLFNKDNKIYYVSLGDSLALGEDSYGRITNGYSKQIKKYLKNKNKLEEYIEYTKSGQTISELSNNITNNQEQYIKEKKHTIKNDLIKADIITLSVGANDLLNKIKANENINYNEIYDYIDELEIELEKLLNQIRNISKEKIYFIGYYNPYPKLSEKNIDPLFNYINKRYKEITKQYKVIYIENYKDFKINKNYLPNENNIHPNEQGYKNIANKIISQIKA